MEMMIALFCQSLVVAGLIVGCATIPPGHVGRWAIYGLCSCFVVGGVWLNLLPSFGLSAPTMIEKYITIGLVTFILKWGMEDFLPRWF